MNLKPTYIYAISCPVSKTVVYIGQTIDPTKRYYAHKLNGCSLISRWLKAMNSIKVEPVFEIIDVTYGNADRMECQYIEYYSSIGMACHNVKANHDKHVCSKRTCLKKCDNNDNVINEKIAIINRLSDVFRNYKISLTHGLPVYAVREIKRLVNTCDNIHI